LTDALFDRFAIALPGPWISHADRDFAGDLVILLGCAVDQFNDALQAFVLFRPFTAEHVRRDSDETPVIEDGADARLRRLYAKYFIYSLDAVRAFVQVISRLTGVSAATTVACEKFQREFGFVRDIRNSLQHIEERAQAQGSPGKRLSGPILDLGSLNERRFGITAGDGRHLEVEISEFVVQSVRDKLLDVIWSVDWLGPGQIPLTRSSSTP
jgi:hypothetical protein